MKEGGECGCRWMDDGMGMGGGGGLAWGGLARKGGGGVRTAPGPAPCVCAKYGCWRVRGPRVKAGSGARDRSTGGPTAAAPGGAKDHTGNAQPPSKKKQGARPTKSAIFNHHIHVQRLRDTGIIT